MIAIEATKKPMSDGIIDIIFLIMLLRGKSTNQETKKKKHPNKNGR